MTAETITSVTIAGVAVLGSMGSVLLLAFRIGRVTGLLSGFMRMSEEDRTHLWRELGALSERFYTHVAEHRVNQ